VAVIANRAPIAIWQHISGRKKHYLQISYRRFVLFALVAAKMT
jgi:hypothetical protein